MSRFEIELTSSQEKNTGLLNSSEFSNLPFGANHFSEPEPTRAEILLQLGILYWRRGQFDRSEQLLTKASQVTESSQNIRFLAQCFIGLALVKTSLDKGNDAIAAYERAIPLDPDNFHLWNNLAKLYLQYDRMGKALSAYKKALSINCKDLIAWNGLANAYYQAGSIDEAINAYERAIDLMSDVDKEKLESGFDLSYTSKHLVLPWIRLAELYSKKCQYQKAIKAYLKVLMVDSENADAWNEIGSLYMKMEFFEESINAFSKSIELSSSSGQAHLNLAFALTQLGKHQDSISHYLESIGLLKNRPDKELALDLMEDAIQNIQKQHNRKAAKGSGTFKENSYSCDEMTWFYYKYNEEITTINLACSTYNREKLTQKVVMKLTNKVNEKDNHLQQSGKGESDMPYISPSSADRDSGETLGDDMTAPNQKCKDEATDPQKWNEKGNFHFNRKLFDEAIKAYQRAIEIDSKFGQPYNNLALIHFIQGNYSEAIQLYQEGIKHLSTNQEKAIALNGLGNVYRCIKDYENARIAYQHAAELDETKGGVTDGINPYIVSEKSKTSDFWVDLGKLFFKAGVYDRAASALKKSIKLNPTCGQSYGYLARVFAAQAKYDDAIDLYQKSINLLPNNETKAKVWYRLGDVYRKLNNYDDALKAYQNAKVLTDDKHNLLSRTRRSLLSNCSAK